jgi:hypothetical protein
VLRPDQRWALMLVNKDQPNAHSVRISFQDGNSARHFVGSVDMITFGSEQYQWHPSPTGGSADPDGPAVKSRISATAETTYTLPKASVVILRGSVSN